MSRGYVWFALNNSKTDYIELSRKLARSIKKYNRHNSTCIITNQKVNHELFDHVHVLKQDASSNEEWKLSNEYKAFRLSPFTHTIKLEADMLFTQNTDWWWYHLWQHDQVFAYHCRNYQDAIIKKSSYRSLFARNDLPDIYSGLTYFRKSIRAKQFYDICEAITHNWETCRNKILINCHDQQPTTDVVYALAKKIQDPLEQHKIDFEWFNFMHNKQRINNVNFDNDEYLYPMSKNGKIYIGGYAQNRIVHYHNKRLAEVLDV